MGYVHRWHLQILYYSSPFIALRQVSGMQYISEIRDGGHVHYWQNYILCGRLLISSKIIKVI